ncbi:MAG: type II secretion system protein GspE, partial [Acidobacteria bacterium]
MSFRLGEILVKKGLLKPEHLQLALKHQKEHGGRLGNVLVEQGYVNDEAVAMVLSQQYDVQFVSLEGCQPDQEVLKLIPIETAIRYQILPLQKTGTSIIVATSDPTNVPALDEIKFRTGYHVQPVIAGQTAIRQAIEHYYGSEQNIELKRVYDELSAGGEYELNLAPDETEVDLGELAKSSSEAPIIRLVNIILAQAIKKGASDIHVEPYEKKLRVRYRVDG